MGTTPNLGLPYPEDADTPNVPRDIKALATKLDGITGPAGSKNHPMRVIRTPVTGNWASFRSGWTGTQTEWREFATPARWKFTPPENGVMQFIGSFKIGYLSGQTVASLGLDFYLRWETLSGTGAFDTYPLYGRTVSGPISSGKTTDHLDQTHTFARYVYAPKGTVISPTFMWRGIIKKADYPRYASARIAGLWIPGEAVLEDAMHSGSVAEPYTVASAALAAAEPGGLAFDSND